MFNREFLKFFFQVEILLQRGAEASFRDKLGRSALHLAAGRGWMDVVRLLWSKAAEIDGETEDGMTPLHLAALNGHMDVVSFLVSKNALLMSEDKEDNTPLHAAARQGHSQVVHVMLNHGASPWQKNKFGLTPGGSALLGGHPTTADVFITTGWNPQERLQQGYSLLHLAAALGRPQSVRWLLSYGSITVDDADNAYRLTPLHCAVLGKDFRCVKLLVDAGANKAAMDYQGSIPSQLLPLDINERIKEEIAKMIEIRKDSAPRYPESRAKMDTIKPSVPTAGTVYETFKASSAEDQVRRVQMWINASFDNEQLEGIIKDFPGHKEMLRCIQLARSLRSAIETLKAIISLKHDEDFQNDMADLSVRKAVELLTKDPSKYDALVQNDHRIASVVGRMRVVHAAVKSQGGSFQLGDVIVHPSKLDEQKNKDADTLRCLGEQFDSVLEGIVTAACALSASQAVDAVKLALVKNQEDPVPNTKLMAKSEPDSEKFLECRKFWQDRMSKMIFGLSALLVLLLAVYYSRQH